MAQWKAVGLATVLVAGWWASGAVAQNPPLQGHGSQVRQLAQRNKRTEGARRNAEGEAKLEPFRPGEREKLLADLAAADDDTVEAAAERLQKIARDDHPTEIAKALAPVLSRNNIFPQVAAARALVVWATPDVGRELIEATKCPFPRLRAPAIEALGHVKTDAAAHAATAHLAYFRGEATKALAAMGPVAESATIEALRSSKDGWINKSLLAVLAQIGGENALKAIQELLPKFTSFDKPDAEKSVAAIKRRLRSPPRSPSAKRAAPTSPALRKWRDITGAFEVEATYVDLQDHKVELLRKDGRTLHVPLEKLCDEDRAYVAEQAERPKPSNPSE